MLACLLNGPGLLEVSFHLKLPMLGGDIDAMKHINLSINLCIIKRSLYGGNGEK